MAKLTYHLTCPVCGEPFTKQRKACEEPPVYCGAACARMRAKAQGYRLLASKQGYHELPPEERRWTA